MLVKVKRRGELFYPSQIKGKLAFEKNIILLFKTQGNTLYVDYVDSKSNLGSYEPPLFLSGKMYFLEIIHIPEEYDKYISCIAKQIQDSVSPLYKNKKLECKDDLTVLIE
ncbi:hypothetical protein GWK48_00255 [Metallosphaera tengchongensis]|uniref:Uncharacterized protein n=1 Tax=Metallosphaera tengchongensis TaxID=1532350 RepID=A0A6N0NQR1_9CREN|nr:hypothetical protein [Metallosphaera tengchongensis]QKQ99031.1 hypothetical protein GWK48_00255 [Metallosphaera tengchongensis]